MGEECVEARGQMEQGGGKDLQMVRWEALPVMGSPSRHGQCCGPSKGVQSPVKRRGLEETRRKGSEPLLLLQQLPPLQVQRVRGLLRPLRLLRSQQRQRRRCGPPWRCRWRRRRRRQLLLRQHRELGRRLRVGGLQLLSYSQHFRFAGHHIVPISLQAQAVSATAAAAAASVLAGSKHVPAGQPECCRRRRHPAPPAAARSRSSQRRQGRERRQLTMRRPRSSSSSQAACSTKRGQGCVRSASSGTGGRLPGAGTLHARPRRGAAGCCWHQ